MDLIDLHEKNKKMVNKKIDHFNDKLENVQEKVENKIEKLEDKIDNKLEKKDDKIDKIEDKLSSKIDDVKQEIKEVRKTTKTLFKAFAKLHDKLCSNKNYYNWHLKPYSNQVHWATLVVYILVIIFCSGWILGFWGDKDTTKAAAGIPKMVNYQGKLTDNNNIPKPDGSYNFIMRIYDSETDGSCLWAWKGTCGSPTTVPITVTNGLFSVLLGDTSYQSTNALDLDFNTDSYWLQVEVGGETLSPRKRLGAVGYAYNSDTVDGKNETDFALLAGRASGQTLIGGTGSGENLTLQSTSNGTKGEILFGNSAYDEVNNRLGIGTTTPGTGDASVFQTGIEVRNSNAGSDPVYVVSNPSKTYGFGLIGSRSDNFEIIDSTASGDPTRLTITSGGNVGLGGITAPSSLLHLYDGVSGSTNTVITLQTAGAGYPGFALQNASVIYSNLVRPDASNAIIWKNETSGKWLAGINSTGGLGLYGQTSGSVYLYAPAVAGSQSYTLPSALPEATGYILQSTDAGVWSWLNPASITGIDHGTLTGLLDDDHTQYALLAGRSGGQSLTGGTAANDDITIQGTSDSTRTSSYVILQPTAGNVGIGTSAPEELLHIKKDGDVYLKVQATTGSGQIAGIKLQRGTTSDVYSDWNIYDSTGNLYFDVSTNGVATNIMTAATSGLGIGITPTSRLHVVDTLAASPAASVQGALFNITSAGSAAYNQIAMMSQLQAGYTGNQITAGVRAIDYTAGTGVGGIEGTANYGVLSQAVGTTAGYNIGIGAAAQSSSVWNLAGGFRAVQNLNSAALNMGVVGLAYNATTNVAGYFALTSSSTAPTVTSAALIADNATTTSDIFVARDNGTAKFTIGDGGSVTNRAGNTTYVPIDGNVNTYITNATAGDTLVLAAGTYTITDDIDVTKAINIVGQGVNQTIISMATTTKNMFHIIASNVSISNLSMVSTVATGTTYGIYVSGVASTVLTNVNITNVNISMTGTTGTCAAVRYIDASGTIRDVSSSVTTTTGNSYGIHISNEATAEAAATVNIYNADSYTTANGATYSSAYLAYDNSAVSNINLKLYNSRGYATGTATNRNALITIGSAGSNINVNAENCVFQGDDYDINKLVASSTVTLRDCTLVNNTTSGTITYAGTVASLGLISDTIYGTSVSTAKTLWGSTTTGAIAIGGALTTGNLTLGNASASSSITAINGGTAAANTIFNNVTTGSIAIGAATTSGTITIGGTAETGKITLGSSTGIQGIDIGVGGTGAKTITIGDGASTGTTTIKSGSGGIALNTGQVTVTNTLPTSPSAAVQGAYFNITGAGSAAYNQFAVNAVLNAGYTGSSGTGAVRGVNSSAGTGASSLTGASGNYGTIGYASGTTAGYNIGIWGGAIGSSVFNGGGVFSATGSTNTPALNVGVYSQALNATVNVAGYFSLAANSTVASLTAAALMADNGSQAADIFVARDNGTAVFTIADGGTITHTGAAASTITLGSGITTGAITMGGALTTGNLTLGNASATTSTTTINSGSGGVNVNSSQLYILDKSSLGSELVTNGGMEEPYTGGVANGWAKNDSGGVLTCSEETVDVYAGSASQKLTRTSTGSYNTSLRSSNFSAVNGKYYRLTFAIKVLAGKLGHVYIWDGASAQEITAAANITDASWTTKTFDFKFTGTTGSTIQVWFYNEFGQAGTFLLDSVSLKEITGGNLYTGGSVYANGTIYGNTYTGQLATSNISMFSATTSGTITIGGTAGTGAITIGSSSSAQTLNLGTGAGNSTVNIATGAGNNIVNLGGAKSQIINQRTTLSNGTDTTLNRKADLGIATPTTGATMYFKNSSTAVSAAMTISLDNGSTYKNVLKASDNTTAVTSVAANATIMCYYDGTQWLLLTQ